MKANTILKSYKLPLILLSSIIVGSAIGWLLPGFGGKLKPLGDIFLNALFVTVVPLVFFSIASTVAGMATTGRLFKILGWMMVVFVATGIISSSIMVVGVTAFPPAQSVSLAAALKEAGVVIQTPATQPTSQPATSQAPVEAAPQDAAETLKYSQVSEKIVKALTAPDFFELLSKKNMLAMIVFAVLVGLATSAAGDKARPFAAFLSAGNEVFMKVISFIMLYAPVGLGAYFAYLVSSLGPQLLGCYARAMILYYPICILYFFIAFTIYASLAGGSAGVRRFWSNIIPASLTAAGTGSSYATIPSNLLAADRIGVPREISEVVIPMGATIHMDGSCLSAILKIAFLFGIYHMPFSGAETIAIAIAIAILSGTVMSGIPGGGFAGEVLIVVMYGFPPEALPMITLIGTLVDPPATMVNAVGDNVASMIVARITGGRKWMG